MNTVQLHLMLTHVPVLGTIFALLLAALAVLKRSDELKKTALWAFAFSAAFAVPVFLTGEPAEDVIKTLPGVTKAAIETHEDIANIAFGVILSLGAVALAGLAWLRRRPVPQWFAVSVLSLALITSGLLVWTANLGGKVRHTEIATGNPSSLSTHSTDRD